MWWVVYALLAHIMNAGVFVTDKNLLVVNSKISQPARYAALSGLVAAGAAVLLLFSFVPPSGLVIWWSLVAGIWWVAALWLFFIALQAGAPSVVVPLSGSAVPVFTWLAAVLFLGERLEGGILLAVALLILGGVVLAVPFSTVTRTPLKVVMTAIVSGGFFAAYFVTVKHLYSIFTPFLAAFAYNRMGVGLIAAVLMMWLLLRRGKRGERPERHLAQVKKNTAGILMIFLGSKILAMGALLLQNYAISLGSPTVVNALQGTQYLFLLVVAWLIPKWLPQLWHEGTSRIVWLQKLLGVVLVSVGLVFLSGLFLS